MWCFESLNLPWTFFRIYFEMSSWSFGIVGGGSISLPFWGFDCSPWGEYHLQVVVFCVCTEKMGLILHVIFTLQLVIVVLVISIVKLLVTILLYFFAAKVIMSQGLDHISEISHSYCFLCYRKTSKTVLLLLLELSSYKHELFSCRHIFESIDSHLLERIIGNRLLIEFVIHWPYGWILRKQMPLLWMSNV